MAKIIEHGKYWREPTQITDPNILATILVECPECGEKTLIYKYCAKLGLAAWCECGCKFIPDESDIIKEGT